MSEPASELDLLAPLSPMSLIKVAACCLVGGVLGLAVGKVVLQRSQARAVMRVGTSALLGPVVPLSEVKARAESLGANAEDFAHLGQPEPEKLARRYQVLAEVDGSHDGTVVTLNASGSDEALVMALCKARLDRLMATTHAAWVQATTLRDGALGSGKESVAALQKAGADAVNPAEAATFARWAGELTAAHHDAERQAMLSRDSEIIDAPYVVDLGSRKLLLAAVGAFGGLLLGLALTARPARAA